MSKAITVRLKDDQLAALQEAARELRQSPSRVAATFVDEALRERVFTSIEFRQIAYDSRCIALVVGRWWGSN